LLRSPFTWSGLKLTVLSPSAAQHRRGVLLSVKLC
jgi:hypothetical protein